MKLKEKSKFNYDASKILIDSDLFAPSVHCSYYAAFQLMKVAMQTFCGVSYKDIDNYVTINKRSEHAYIKHTILNEIKRLDTREYRMFKNQIEDLFEFRITSDYKDIEIRQEQALKARTLSASLIEFMNTQMIK